MTTSTKACTHGQICAPASDREAWHCQVHHAPEIRVDELARRLGMRDDTLSRMVDPNSKSSMLPARHHARVLQLTRSNLAVVTFYAQLQGVIVYRASSESELAVTAAAVKSFGDLLTTTAEAHADGEMTDAEAECIARRGQLAAAKILAVVEDARQRVRRAGVTR